jgi:hypothetical protein
MEVRSLRQGPGHRFRLSPRLLFVAVCSLAWTGFVLWLTIPRLDDIGASMTIPVAVALVVAIGIVPAVLELQSISERIFGDEWEHRSGR